MTKSPFRIAIAGLGTVGASVVQILHTHADMITARAGRPIEIRAVNARTKTKDRGVDLSAYQWMDDPVQLGSLDAVDCVVELMGGSDGPAYDLAKSALQSGKHLVTANKAMLAHHGLALAKLAEDNNVHIAYEAAVAGGIPAIKSLREGYAGNQIIKLRGILNGTCNYILSVMRETGRAFDDVLKEAQDKGYAEADPGFDIDGIDAAHKLCLLTALAFGIEPSLDTLDISGITPIGSEDIAYASELGYKIKLLGIASQDKDGDIIQKVEPCLVPLSSPISAVEDSFNAVEVIGDFVDQGLWIGRGAGGGPTASAVIADLIDLARGRAAPLFGISAYDLKPHIKGDKGQHVQAFYLHLRVYDQPGVIADIASILKTHSVSVESLIQRGRDPDQPVSVVMTTHDVARHKIESALKEIASLPSMVDAPSLLPIEI